MEHSAHGNGALLWAWQQSWAAAIITEGLGRCIVEEEEALGRVEVVGVGARLSRLAMRVEGVARKLDVVRVHVARRREEATARHRCNVQVVGVAHERATALAMCDAATKQRLGI